MYQTGARLSILFRSRLRLPALAKRKDQLLCATVISRQVALLDQQTNPVGQTEPSANALVPHESAATLGFGLISPAAVPILIHPLYAVRGVADAVIAPRKSFPP